MPRNEDRIELTALIDSMARLPDTPGSFTDSLRGAIEEICASAPVVFVRARRHGEFASTREGGSPELRHSTLPVHRSDPLVRAMEAHTLLDFGSGGEGGLRLLRLAGAPLDDVEAAARKAGLSCVLYLDVAAAGKPAATLQLFTDRVVDEQGPLVHILRVMGSQLERIAATQRFRAAIQRAAQHGRQQVTELESLRERLASKDERLNRLEQEIGELQAEADLRAYRSRKTEIDRGPTRSEFEGASGSTVERAAAQSGAVPSEQLYDSRTELPRRAILEDRIDQAIRRRQRSPKNLFAVLAVSADGLEKVAVEAGSEGLDFVTAALSRRILAQVRSADTVAHLDDATFVVVLEEIRVLDEALRIAERIAKELQRPIWSGSQETRLGVRVGVVFGGPAYDRARSALRDAVSALTRSRMSQTAVAVFDEAAQHEEEIRHRVEVELGVALADDQLHLEFQPIVSLQDGRIEGIEAFLRWRHPEHGLIPPDQFIPLAAQSPLIHDLGVWLLEKSCEQVKAWQTALSRPVPTIDLNVTARQLLHERTPGRVQEVVARHGLRCEQFRFDIPESDLMRNPTATSAALDAIRKLGCQVAIDDFGTGFSSLRLLHSMPIDAVKIDRSFVSGGKGKGQLAVARTIVQLARSLEAEVIAEGVETHDQFRFLKSIGCGSAQGYLFSAPVKGARIVDLIRDGYPLEKPSVR